MMLRSSVVTGVFVVSAVVLVWRCEGAHAVTFEVNPSTIRNDTDTEVALTISNLTAGQKVDVERYADLNGNGTIDPGEPLVQGGRLADGGVPQVAGIRDPNVPGDDDGVADGTIHAHVRYPGVDSADRIAGAFIFRVVDTSGVELARAPFAIMQNTTLPQGVSGTITAADGGLPLANIFVVLVAQRPVGGTVTDASGHYTIYAEPGNYFVVTLAPGFVADQPDGSVDISAAEFSTKNLALTSASLNVSGIVTKASNANPIPGLLVLAESDNGLLAGAFTDTAGQYGLRVTAGQWRIAPNDAGVSAIGFVAVSKTSVTISADTPNLNFALPKGTALIYGQVHDDHGNPVLGIEISADDDNQHKANGITFSPDGGYGLAVIAGTWGVGFNGDELRALGYAEQNVSVPLADGQAVRQDFTLQRLCIGDCNGDHQVTVDEILTMVNIALGNADVMSCSAGDGNGDGQITVDEILTAVNNALNGCS